MATSKTEQATERDSETPTGDGPSEDTNSGVFWSVPRYDEETGEIVLSGELGFDPEAPISAVVADINERVRDERRYGTSEYDDRPDEGRLDVRSGTTPNVVYRCWYTPYLHRDRAVISDIEVTTTDGRLVGSFSVADLVDT
jgi:hypothetical protein